MSKNLLAPSMLSADFGCLQKDIELVNNSAADIFHLDIMDGVFVPNISYGFPVVKAIAKSAKKPLDAHLMIVEPDKYIDRFAESGVEYLSVHYEACPHLHRTVQHIKKSGMKAGVALNPHSPVCLLEDIMCEADFILIMSVNPGFGGQSFIERAIEKIRKAKQMAAALNPEILIEVDGGVCAENAGMLKGAGADILVAGSAVFSSKDPAKAIEMIKGA